MKTPTITLSRNQVEEILLCLEAERKLKRAEIMIRLLKLELAS